MLLSIDLNMTMMTTTYLEGCVFGDLLEEDMPVKHWKGSLVATPKEQ